MQQVHFAGEPGLREHLTPAVTPLRVTLCRYNMHSFARCCSSLLRIYGHQQCTESHPELEYDSRLHSLETPPQPDRRPRADGCRRQVTLILSPVPADMVVRQKRHTPQSRGEAQGRGLPIAATEPLERSERGHRNRREGAQNGEAIAKVQ